MLRRDVFFTEFRLLPPLPPPTVCVSVSVTHTLVANTEKEFREALRPGSRGPGWPRHSQCAGESACEGAGEGRPSSSVAGGGDGGEAAAEGRVNGRHHGG